VHKPNNLTQPQKIIGLQFIKNLRSSLHYAVWPYIWQWLAHVGDRQTTSFSLQLGPSATTENIYRAAYIKTGVCTPPDMRHMPASRTDTRQ